MIDYGKIADAITFYKDFQYIEAPWATSLKALSITMPPGHKLFPLEDRYLVASAEQSFLQMIQDKLLKPGKYLTVTPCFRDDPISETHQRYFIKAELINYTEKTWELDEMLQQAFKFFQRYLKPQIVETSTPDALSFDINSSKGIELGSYGIRYHSDIGYWIYGTGVAEPRLSYAIGSESR